MHCLSVCEVGPEFVSRRKEFREEHPALVWQAIDAGRLLLGGAFSGPTDQAQLLFAVDSPDVAIRIAKSTRTSARAWSSAGASSSGIPS